MNKHIIFKGNRFLVGSNDVRIYEYSQDGIKLDAVNSDVSLMKCVDWSTKDDNVVVGLTNGIVQLLKMSNIQTHSLDKFDSSLIVQFTPKHPRACNAVSFAPSSNHFAAGLDKVRNDYCLALWDVVSADKPLFQWGPSEAVSSVSWINNSLSAGMGNKWVRIYDTRVNSTTPVIVIHTRAVNGITPDPFNPYRITSFTDDSDVFIWDIRTINQNIANQHILTFRCSSDSSSLISNQVSSNSLTRIMYSDTRKGHLASLSKDCSFLRIWDLQDSISKEDIEIPILFKTKETKSLKHSIASFAWIPSADNSFLTISRSGTIETLQFHEPHKLSWCNRGVLTISKGNRISSLNLISSTQFTSVVKQSEPTKRPSVTGNSLSPIHENIVSQRQSVSNTVKIAQLSLHPSMRLSNDFIYTNSLLSPDPDSSTSSFHVKLSVGHFSGILRDPSATMAERVEAGYGIDPNINYTIISTEKQELLQKRSSLMETINLNPPSIMSMRKRNEAKNKLHVTLSNIGELGYDNFQTLKALDEEIGLLFSLEEAWDWAIRIETLYKSGKLLLHHQDYSYQGILMIISASNGPNANPVSTIVESYSKPTIVTDAPSLQIQTVGINTAAMAYTAALNSTTTFIPVSAHPMHVPGSFESVSSVESTNSAPVIRHDSEKETTKLNSGSVEQGNVFKYSLYSSSARKMASLICGWGSIKDPLEEVLKKLENDGEFEKAAAWALFHMNVPRSIQSLNSSGDERYKIISTSLAGFSTFMKQHNFGINNQAVTSNLWQDMCRNLGNELEDPYLRVMFTFISSGGNFQSVLEEKGLPLRDRLAIALRFLPDDQLMAYIQRVTKKLVFLGDIEGVLLTGVSSKLGIELLQRYLDKTGDIQTVALLLSQCPKSAFRENGITSSELIQFKNWVELYREYLDKCKLFHNRCDFDISRRARYAYLPDPNSSISDSSPSSPFSKPTRIFPSPNVSPKINTAADKELNSLFQVPAQLYARCNFCNQSLAQNSLLIPGVGIIGMNMTNIPANAGISSQVSSGMSTPIPSTLITNSSSAAPHMLHHHGSSLKVKSIACSSCRKPLPRCAICLMHLGSSEKIMETGPQKNTSQSGISGLSYQPEDDPLTDNSENKSKNADDSAEYYAGVMEYRPMPKRPEGLDLWFTWCQTCRHGGHLLHIQEWFENHPICPVSGCSCVCNKAY